MVNCNYGYRVNYTIYHDTFGLFTYTILINRRNMSLADASDLNTMFETIFGANTFQFLNILSIFILLAGLFAFGEAGAGISLLGTGFTFLFLNMLIVGFITTTVIPILFIILGLMVTWQQNRRSYG